MGQPLNYLDLTINGTVRRFGRVGFGINLDVAPEIRRLRRKEYALMLEDLTGNTVEVRHAAMSCFDQLVRDVTVSRYETDQWLKSREGEAYQIWKSLSVFHPKTLRNVGADVIEYISIEQFAQLNKFLLQQVTDTALPPANTNPTAEPAIQAE